MLDLNSVIGEAPQHKVFHPFKTLCVPKAKLSNEILEQFLLDFQNNFLQYIDKIHNQQKFEVIKNGKRELNCQNFQKLTSKCRKYETWRIDAQTRKTYVVSGVNERFFESLQFKYNYLMKNKVKSLFNLFEKNLSRIDDILRQSVIIMYE